MPPAVVRLARWLAILAGLYLFALLALLLWQRRLIYFPTRLSSANALALARKTGFNLWTNRSGAPIGWWRPPPFGKGGANLLVLHGNAGWALDRRDYADAFQAIAPFNVYLLEYPGYGQRPGRPSEETLLRAAAEAIQSLPTDQPLYLIGESLGSGPAAYLAGAQPSRIAGLLLVAPFAELADVAQHHMPLFPARWLLRDRFPAATWLGQYRGPVAVWLAGRDTVVPKQFGRQLFQAYTGRKQLWEYPELDHNELPLRPREDWEQVVEFWSRSREPIQ